jgi:hypothetical protein
MTYADTQAAPSGADNEDQFRDDETSEEWQQLQETSSIASAV